MWFFNLTTKGSNTFTKNRGNNEHILLQLNGISIAVEFDTLLSQYDVYNEDFLRHRITVLAV
jgi:hypothetical protein